MSNETSPRRPATKAGNTGAPIGSTISIVVAVIAVIIGFLILKDIRDGSASSKGVKPASTVVAGTTNSTSTTSSTTQTTATFEPAPSATTPLVTAGAKVVVANASIVNGSAGQMTDSLAKAGFSMGKATNAAAPEAELDVSKVYFVAAPPEAEAVARSVAQAMGITDIQAIPTPAPTKSGDIGDAGVLVMLGKDTAGKPLAAFVAATTTTATTVAPAAQAPIQSTTTTG